MNPSRRPTLQELGQRSLFERVAKETRQAIDKGEANADELWKAQALEAIRVTCRRMQEFFCDDIWEIGKLARTRDDRALGSVIRKAAALGWCIKTDRMRPSVRSHLSPKPVWRSLLYGTNPVS